MSDVVEMNELLELAVEEGASDVHLSVGIPPVLRIRGGLTQLDSPPLMPEDTERLMKSITSPEHQQKVREGGGTDFGFGFGDKARFRVSVLKKRGYRPPANSQHPVVSRGYRAAAADQGTAL